MNDFWFTVTATAITFLSGMWFQWALTKEREARRERKEAATVADPLTPR